MDEATINEVILGFEKQTGLSKESLAQLKSAFNSKTEEYVAALWVLTQSKTQTLSASKSEQGESFTTYEFNGKTVVVDEAFIDKLRVIGNDSQHAPEYKKEITGSESSTSTSSSSSTSPKQNNILKPPGKEGVVTAMNPKTIPTSPMGPQTHSSTLTEQLLNKIHPKFTQNLEKYLNLIKSRAYLALPMTLMGSAQGILSKLNNILGAFQKIVFDVYKGIIKAIQQFYSYINQIISMIQKFLISLIEQIIPFDLICLILEAVQVILDDIMFFSSLFGQNGSVINFVNQAQSYLNIANTATTMLANPLGTAMQFMPPEVQNVFNLVNQVGSDPTSFLSDQLTNFGYGWAMNALQGNVLGTITGALGSQYAAFAPIGQIISSIPISPKPENSVSPTIYFGANNNKITDVNLNPVDFVKSTVNDFVKDANLAKEGFINAIRPIT